MTVQLSRYFIQNTEIDLRFFNLLDWGNGKEGAKFIEQKTGVRGQRTDDRRQRTESR
jgi:hypothetical protein